MCSSNAAPPSSLFLRTTLSRSLIPRCNPPFYTLPYSFLRSKNPTLLRLSASVTHDWFSPAQSSADDDGFNGWAVIEAPPLTYKKKGFSTVLTYGGTCVAFVVAIAYFSLSGKGFKLQFHTPLSASHGMISPISNRADRIEAMHSSTAVFDESAAVSEASQDTPSSAATRKLERVKVSMLVDSTQLEALAVLKKFKIIEDDVRADELCTRREYARWLVRLNSLLERNPKYRIVPSLLLSSSVVAAFDDVGVEDPDFDSIQALAEAGFILSKISGTNDNSNSSKGGGNFCFHPEKFISRQDLINWKAQLEYKLTPGVAEQMSRTKVDYMDVKEISSDASPELLIDMLAGEKSIIRKVFGQSRRFQPNKPLTKAQAAVALASGRMAEAVHNEVLRLESDNLSRQAAMQEIRSELLARGHIERFWVEKMNEERARGKEVQEFYITSLHDLEQEKTIQEKILSEVLMQKAAMDCQRQMLQSLKEEVDEMSERVASERAIYFSEQCNLQELLSELQTKQEGTLDSKSVLEAEIEALRILRSWVEDGARKSQASAEVLEEVGRRWKWDNQS